MKHVAKGKVTCERYGKGKVTYETCGKGKGYL